MEKFNDQLYDETQFKFRPKKVYYAYARAVWELLRPKNLLDLGCATGYALDWWQKQGIKVNGIEPALAAFKFMPEAVKTKVRQLDLRRRLKLKTYDLVNCTEVAEHIDLKYERVMLKNVVQCVKNYLIISWSNEFYPDKPNDHINPRPAFYVKIRLRRLGLYFEPELTQELKAKLNQPVLTNWRHWQKNILVFSRTPQKRRVLIRHYEWLPSYVNKNIGYFMDSCRALGLEPRWGKSLFGRWQRVWLYPFERHLLTKLLILKLLGNKTILKLDSQVLPRWRAGLIKPLVYRVLAESEPVARPFGKSKKIVYFSGGLSRKNLNLIRGMRIKREKIILYSGRQTYAKGFDRLKKIIPKGWKLKVVSDLPPADYYREIKKSSLVVLPTRGEGWPNVFQDAWFCRRLFLTTTKARCSEGILNLDFYQDNLEKAILKITRKLDWYYKNYSKLYDSRYFQLTDPIFSRLLKEAD